VTMRTKFDRTLRKIIIYLYHSVKHLERQWHHRLVKIWPTIFPHTAEKLLILNLCNLFLWFFYVTHKFPHPSITIRIQEGPGWGYGYSYG